MQHYYDLEIVHILEHEHSFRLGLAIGGIMLVASSSGIFLAILGIMLLVDLICVVAAIGVASLFF